MVEAKGGAGRGPQMEREAAMRSHDLPPVMSVDSLRSVAMKVKNDESPGQLRGSAYHDLVRGVLSPQRAQTEQGTRDLAPLGRGFPAAHPAQGMRARGLRGRGPRTLGACRGGA